MMDFFKSGTRREIGQSILWIVLVGVLSFLLNLYWNPRYVGMKPDSSLFAYGGKMVTEGKLLYRDFWDHKPPAIFYTDALEILLMGATPWAFWWADIAWVAVSTAVLYFVLRKLAGTLPALLASGIFLVTIMYPTLFSGGNLAEVYAVLPQILIIAAAYAFFKTGRDRWAFVAGLLTAAAFLFKQTCVALGIGAALAVLYQGVRSRQIRKGLITLLWLTAGVLLPLGLVAGYWIIRGAFCDLIDAVFLYNIFYVNSGLSLETFINMLRTFLAEFPLMPLSLASLGAAAAFLVENRGWLFSRTGRGSETPSTDRVPAAQWTFLAVFLALPFEVLFIVMGGRNFPHYYITILPACAAAIAYLAGRLAAPLLVQRRPTLIEAGALVVLLFLGLSWLVNAYSAEKPEFGVMTNLRQPLYGPLPHAPIEDYVISHTRPDESVLVWVNNKNLNFLTGRRTPTRYLYPLHLFAPKSGPESRFDQFLGDLHNDPPKLIIWSKASAASLPFITAPDDQLCPGCIPEAVAGMQAFKTYVNTNYTLVSDDDQFAIYQRNP